MHSSIYPVASLHLPGSLPTRQSAGIQGRVAGIVSRLAGPDAAGAVHVRRGDRRLLQCLPSLDGRRRIPTGLGRVQPERRPPQPRQWIGVGSGDTRPGLLLGSPVGGGPVHPRFGAIWEDAPRWAEMDPTSLLGLARQRFRSVGDDVGSAREAAPTSQRMIYRFKRLDVHIGRRRRS